jgi:DNA/RNA endonuclease G (NUC1)
VYKVSAGQALTGVNFTSVKMEKLSSISGKITGSDGNIPTGSIELHDVTSASDWDDSSVDLSKTGTFTFDEVDGGAGSYKLRYVSDDGHYVSGWIGGETEAGATVYTVSPGQALVGVNYSATKAATISGKVVGSAGNVPEDGSVDAYDAVSGDLVSYGSDLSETGTFSVGGLSAGSYKLRFGNSDNYSDGWFGGAAEAAATVYKVSTGQALTGVNYTAAKTARISGKFTGVPAGSNYYLYLVNTAGERIDWSEQSGGDSSFSFEGLSAGSYKVFFESTGSVPAQYVGGGAGMTFTVASGESKNAGTIALTQGKTTSISGTIDLNGLNLWENDLSYDARLYVKVGSTWVKTPVTNSNMIGASGGAYSIPGLGAGSYTVGFEKSQSASSTAKVFGEFYKNRRALANADTVTLSGTPVSGINGTVRATPLSALAAGTPSISGAATVGSTLTANAGTWTSGTTLAYQWLRDGIAISGATRSTYAVVAADRGHKLSVMVTGSKDGFETVSKTSAAVAATDVFSTVPVPTISGTAKAGSTLTATAGAWSPAATLTYQWLRDGSPISGATKSTYVVATADRGHKVSVTVMGSAAGYQSAAKTSAVVSVASVFPSVPTPTISGTATAGSTLSANAGTWTSGVTLAYQWLRDGTAISGATASTYTVVAADRGHKLSVTVTGSKDGFETVSKTSAAVTVANVFAAAPVPTISGTPSVGSTLTATAGTWSPSATLAYQWLRDGSPISGATTSTYVVAAADRGHKLSVTVMGSASGYQSASKTSAALSVANVFPSVPTPTISGTATAGSTLTANAGTWTSGAALAYQWLRDGTVISGATASTYTVATADRGHKLSVKVTGSKSGYLTTTKTSAVIGVANVFAAAPTPTISGTPTVGSTLTATAGAWSPAATLAYQWLRDGSPISGATKSTYVVAAADRGHKVSVRVTATKSGYLTTAKMSAAVSVPNVFAATPTPTVSGTPTVGSTLTAKPGTWSPAATLAYQWLRDGKAISGATKSTYKIATADRGHKLSVTVTGSKAGYLSASKSSAAVAVLNVFAKAPAPALSGVAKAGSTLTVKPGTWSPAPKLSYQWLRDGKAISKATKSTYKIATADRGHKVSVRVTASKSGYLTTVKTSATVSVANVFSKAPVPKISGKVKAGVTVKVSVGSWSPAPKFSYQWLRDGKAIAKATASSYKVSAADRRHALSVRVTATKSGYETASRTSGATRVP